MTFSTGFLRLVSPDGRILLDSDDAIANVGLKDGETWKMLLWVENPNISVQRADLYRRMLGAFPDLSCIVLVDFNFSEFTVTANELFGNCPQYRFMALEEDDFFFH